MKLITVFTPTYNREKLLERLYKSLLRQTSKNFEWLIVDDDSKDGTEAIVKKWQKENNIEIRYFKQNHGGKHRALNKAFDLAKGRYFFTVDSDDYLVDNSILLIEKWAEEIDELDSIAAVSGLKVHIDGQVCGGETLVSGYIDASDFEREKYGLLGDKAEVYKTDVIKKYKFPEFDNEYFITEDYCYMRIAADGYKIRWYNEPIYVCEYLEEGLSKTGANDYIGHKNNYRGYSIYIRECIKLKPISQKYLYLKDYLKTAKKMGLSIKNILCDLDINFIHFIYLLIIICPAGYIKRKVTNLIYKKRRKNG
ncbi:MAG: glycosyltransferase family 2 protein [Clostridia bacterium]|nr:glycosyltransferase family 2 protein [Clostridia bacterium]